MLRFDFVSAGFYKSVFHVTIGFAIVDKKCFFVGREVWFRNHEAGILHFTWNQKMKSI